MTEFEWTALKPALRWTPWTNEWQGGPKPITARYVHKPFISPYLADGVTVTSRTPYRRRLRQYVIKHRYRYRNPLRFSQLRDWRVREEKSADQSRIARLWAWEFMRSFDAWEVYLSNITKPTPKSNIWIINQWKRILLNNYWKSINILELKLAY